jgi:hypothetical protein
MLEPVAGGDQTRWRSPGTTALTLGNKIMIRYLSSHGIETLMQRRLKVSLPSSFNDPFEYIFYNAPWGDGTTFIRSLIDTRIRILCFSDSTILSEKGDVLMWSHYGGSHKGLRVHFDRSFLEHSCELWNEIEYLSEIPEYPWYADSSIDLGSEEAFKCLSASLFGKADCWSYEKEVRYFYKKEKCSREGSLDYISFPESAVKRVDIGIEFPEEDIERLLNITQKFYLHCDVYKAYRIPGEFSIEYKKISPNQSLVVTPLADARVAPQL